MKVNEKVKNLRQLFNKLDSFIEIKDALFLDPRGSYTVIPFRWVPQPKRQLPVGDKIYHHQSPRYRVSLLKRSIEMSIQEEL